MNKIPSKEKLETLLKYFNYENFEEAEKLAISLKKEFPNHSFSWKILAIINRRRCDFKTSLNYAKEAIKLFPNDPEFYNILGNIFKESKKIQEAKISFEKAIELNRNYTEAYYNLGIIFEELNEIEISKKKYLKAISLNPNLPQVYNNLGNIFSEERNYDEAEINYKKSISLNPNYLNPYNNLGGLYEKILKFHEAEIYYTKTIFLNPNYAEGYNNLANVYAKIGKYEKAETNYKKAIALKKNFPDPHYNLGVMFFNLRKYDIAKVELENSLKINNKNSSAFSLLLFLYQHICKFNLKKKTKEIKKSLGIYKNAIEPFFALGWEDNPKNQYLRSLNYTANNFKYKKSKPIIQKNLSRKKIKIGYFCSDFYNFPTMYLLIRLLENHNKEKFEIIALSYGVQIIDEMNKRIKSAVDKFIDISNLTSAEIIKISKKLEIDIAIDLNGYTKNSRSDFFQSRICPIQINYLGFPSTMGADFIDYIVADKVLISNETRKFYSEKVIFMPHTYQPNDDTRIIDSKTTNKSEFGLPETGFIFCCFNQNYKIGYREFCIWMRILKKNKESVLWLLKSNIWAEQNLLKECRIQGVDPGRIIFAEKISNSEHLARHQHANLFVDTFNYNAHTTASDALWSGLPIITKKGQQFSSRVCASLLEAIGLPELITENEYKYEELINFYASNPSKLLSVKKKLSQNILKEPLFDSLRYTRNFEKALEKTIDINLKNNEPEDIWITETVVS